MNNRGSIPNLTRMPENELRDRLRALSAADPEDQDDKGSDRRQQMRAINQELNHRDKSE